MIQCTKAGGHCTPFVQWGFVPFEPTPPGQRIEALPWQGPRHTNCAEATHFDAVRYSLGTRVDFAQLVKVYAAPCDGEQRYSPAEVVDAVPVPQWGRPDPRKICASHVENQNLQIRKGLRRMTRLTNAFSKKWENLKAALALYFAHFNFCKVHGALRVTPAMEAGITDSVWDIDRLLSR